MRELEAERKALLEDLYSKLSTVNGYIDSAREQHRKTMDMLLNNKRRLEETIQEVEAQQLSFTIEA